MGAEKLILKTCEEGGGHFPSKRKYGVPMKRDGEIIVIDMCEDCKSYYRRNPTEDETRNYEVKEKFMRERGFNI
jgi:hypothetical protein